MSRSLRSARVSRDSLLRMGMIGRSLSIPSHLATVPPRFAAGRWRCLCSKVRGDNPMGPKERKYWKTVMEELQSPIAREMYEKKVDLSDVTGVDKMMDKSPANFSLYRSIKRQHPLKIPLIQNGKFYEVIGHDAVILIACGLAPMGNDNTPRAGFPISSLEKYVKIVRDEWKLSLMVYNQSDEVGHNGKKHRYLDRIYNPGYGGYSDDAPEDAFQSATASLICLTWSEGDFRVLEYRVDQGVIRVMSGMTEDALWGHLVSKTVVAPVCVHSSFEMHVLDWKLRIKNVLPGVARRIWHLDDEDPLTGFQEFLKEHNCYEEDHEIPVRHQDTRRYPSLHTAAELGITGRNGIPNILDFIVQPNSISPVKDWFKNLLLVPRPIEATQAIQDALKQILDIKDSLPCPKTYLSPTGVEKTFQARVLSVTFLRKVNALLQDVTSMSGSTDLDRLSEKLLSIVEMEQETPVSIQKFWETCNDMQRAIEDVLVPENSESEARENVIAESEFYNSMKPSPTKHDKLKEFFVQCDATFAGLVRNHHIAEQLAVVESCKERVSSAVYDILGRLAELTDASEVERDTDLVVDEQAGTVYFTLPMKLLKHQDIETAALIAPDRTKTKKRNDHHKHRSSIELEVVVKEYKDRCQDVKAEANRVLQSLQDQLDRQTLLTACRFGITAQSLIEHAYLVKDKSWSFPELTEDKELSITDMWPYWMDMSDETVTNSLELKDVVLLTGPNMSGKSTVLRSIAAVVMLASSGLCVPAVNVQIPVLDHIVLRSFSGDNPLGQHSGFSLEMEEMASAVAKCSERSLILVDELGKGTEEKTAAVITASLLEHFAETGCIGVFSTHLHLIKQMQLNTKRITMMKMNTNKIELEEEQQISRPLTEIHKPEWKVTPGYNQNSLGIQVAWECGLDKDIITNAIEYDGTLRAQSGLPVVQELIEQELLNLAPMTLASAVAQNGNCESVIGSGSVEEKDLDIEVKQKEDFEMTLVVPQTQKNGKGTVSPSGIGSDSDGNADSSNGRTESLREVRKKAKAFEEIGAFITQVMLDNKAQGNSLPDTQHTMQDQDLTTTSEEPADNAVTSNHPETMDSTEDANNAVSLAQDEISSADVSTMSQDELLLHVCKLKGLRDSDQPLKVHYVKEGHQPPPATTQRSCIYIIRRTGGHHYVGQTDDLKGRLQQHKGRRFAKFGQNFETWYVLVPKSQGAKSMSRAIEATLIETMERAGFLMQSTNDKRNKNFGIRK